MPTSRMINKIPGPQLVISIWLLRRRLAFVIGKWSTEYSTRASTIVDVADED